MRNNKDRIYIERREQQRDYAIRRGGSERARATADTQAEAIAKAKKMFPEQRPEIERVRNTTKGHRDKWR